MQHSLFTVNLTLDEGAMRVLLEHIARGDHHLYQELASINARIAQLGEQIMTQAEKLQTAIDKLGSKFDQGLSNLQAAVSGEVDEVKEAIAKLKEANSDPQVDRLIEQLDTKADDIGSTLNTAAESVRSIFIAEPLVNTVTPSTPPPTPAPVEPPATAPVSTSEPEVERPPQS